MATPPQADRAPERVMREWFTKLWNEGQEDTIDRLMAPDCQVHGLGVPIKGPAGFKPFYHQFRSAFPDIHVDIEQTLVDGNKVAAHCRVKGRHTGHTLGGAATDREVEFTGLVMARVVDGKVVECWNVFDFLGMYQQMSWVKMPVMP
jgi:predicted ester cyclase